jgi:Flp pilus assembly protein TadG
MRARRGQALVEFALSIGVFMLLVLGTFDLSRAYLAYTVVSNSAREASRYALAHQGEPGWDTQAIQAGRNLAIGVNTDPAILNLAVTWNAPTGYVDVTATYSFHSLTPLVGALLGDPIDMQVHTSALAG